MIGLSFGSRSIHIMSLTSCHHSLCSFHEPFTVVIPVCKLFFMTGGCFGSGIFRCAIALLGDLEQAHFASIRRGWLAGQSQSAGPASLPADKLAVRCLGYVLMILKRQTAPPFAMHSVCSIVLSSKEEMSVLSNSQISSCCLARS